MTGRGGSGTRLLSELMQRIDLFIGNDINKTQDSTEWQVPIYDLVLRNNFIRAKSFGKKEILRLRNNACCILQARDNKISMWGWKLPETILVLPEMFQAFPKAKLIHLTRHPASVCLRRTHMTSRPNEDIGKEVLSKAYKRFGLDIEDLLKTPEHINNAVSWAYQMEAAFDHISTLNQNQYLLIKYEDIVSKTADVYSRICTFLDIPYASPPVLNIENKRLNQSLEIDKNYEEVWNICGQIAEKYQYTKQIGQHSQA